MSKVVIDVREPIEYKLGHVKGAINISPGELMGGTNKLDEIPKDVEIILYCRSGARSNVAMNIMKQMGYTNLVNGINKNQVEAKFL